MTPRKRAFSPGRLDPAEPSEARPAVILVGTPIGNLGDLSPRAVEALTGADVIAAEDTRRTRPLLTAAGIPSAGRLVSFHGPDEPALAAKLVERIVERNERLVCVTDAGMPGISDPGERLVTAALAAGVAVEVVPGPSAVLAALVLSGLPTARFVFEGFLPRKGRPRAERLEGLRTEERTVVLFEAPHRLAGTLEELAEVLGADRSVAVAREITKKFETVWRGTLGGAVGEDGPDIRGEQVIVLGPAAPDPQDELSDELLQAALRTELDSGASARDAAAVVANRFGVARRRAYDLAASLKGTARS
jgi:16S rRNA (cytidine1402-2'-O)-methyltransferase